MNTEIPASMEQVLEQIVVNLEQEDYLVNWKYQPLFSPEALMSEISYVDHAMPNMVD